MVEWLAGNRIQGTSTERTTGAGFNPISAVAGGWKEVGRTTLGSSSSTITVSSLPDKKYYMALCEFQADAVGGTDSAFRFNSDSGSNYATRYSSNGGADNTAINQDDFYSNQSGGSRDEFQVGYFSNLAGKEKLGITYVTHHGSSGAGTAPVRNEAVGKWANTTDSINSIQTYFSDGGAQAGDELVILGWDPADTHTTNFWEELASVNASGSSSTLSSGTITAKKYLWLQFYSDNMGAGTIRFNSDTGNNYSRRYSANGGSDVTSLSLGYLPIGYTTTAIFHNIFIINNSANEKLCIIHDSERNTAGAGNAPYRMEEVGKWANTSSQITQIDLSQNSNFASSSILKVWGSN